MSTFDFNHELIFNTVFDSSVITNSEIEDKDAGFIQRVQEEFDKINMILTLYAGVTVMSSFVDYNTRRYKITVNK